MKDNESCRGEYLAGMARSRADWVCGMNLSRYVTRWFEQTGYDVKAISVGRVQTPTLGLVVRRDRDIACFVPKPYFDIYATLSFPTGNRKISGRWILGDEKINGFDEDKRLIDRNVCEALKEKLTDATGTVLTVDKKMRKLSPPLPYNLAQLQIDASRKYDITDTLVHAQKLYEQGFITYPRSGCRYIPEGHFADAEKILKTISTACPGMGEILKAADASRKSAAWDDSFVTEHHAILPTTRVASALSDNERKIYELICTRYALQFLPEHEYRETTVEFEAAGERFKASGREVVVAGWKSWGESEEDKASSEGGEDDKKFPVVITGEKGEIIPCVNEKMTSPPKRFTYDGLLGAMNSVYLYVEDPEARKQLKELDGIGTSATQEGLVKVLFERGFIEKRKKQIYSTPAGQSLIDALNSGKASMLVKPELTALWEQRMTQIEKGALELDVFISEVSGMISEIVKSPLAVPEISGLMRKKKCLTENCTGYLRHIKTGKSLFFACSICGNTFNDRDGEPIKRKQSQSGEKVEADCPMDCGRKARRLEGKFGYFWKCECSPDVILKDNGGRPTVPETRLTEKCPVNDCKGIAQQLKTKDGSRMFWKCPDCRNMFSDVDGKPVITKKYEKTGGKNVTN